MYSEPPVIREAEERDAQALLNLRLTLDRESNFMMVESGERAMTVDDQLREIASFKSRDNATILAAESGGQLVALLELDGGAFRRNRHSATIVTGVLAAFAGRGIGAQLFREAETWASRHGIHRLELTVMTHNAPTIAFYTRQGFQIEGTRRDSLLVTDCYVDEYRMAKLLR